MWFLVPLLSLLIAWIVNVNVSGTFVDDGVTLTDLLQVIASPAGISRNLLLLSGNLAPSFLIIVVGLLAALFIGDEKSQNMWKTVLTVAPNRFAVLTGKLLAAMILLGVILWGGFLSGIVFGSIGMIFLPLEFGSGWGQLAQLYALEWLFCTAAMLFAFWLIWLFRNVALGVVGVFFLPNLLEGLYSIYAAVVGFDRVNRFNVWLEALQLQNTLRELPQYFFTTNLYAPSRYPIADLVGVIGGDLSDIGGPFSNFFEIDLSQAAVVMSVYGAIFAVLLAIGFWRSDVQ
jgi:ABC-type transport system involved in multi-copper enzyme maturation permease subunit